MADRSRILGGLGPPPTPPPPHRSASPSFDNLDADFFVTIASLLCAITCVLGLAVLARCAWIRRFAERDSAAAPPATANQGLKKKVMKSLPKTTYGESRDQAERLSECAICLAEFAAGEEIRVLPQCGHGFHVACIDAWLVCHSSCPSCRQILQDAGCQDCGSIPAEAAGANG